MPGPGIGKSLISIGQRLDACLRVLRGQKGFPHWRTGVNARPHMIVGERRHAHMPDGRRVARAVRTATERSSAISG